MTDVQFELQVLDVHGMQMLRPLLGVFALDLAFLFSQPGSPLPQPRGRDREEETSQAASSRTAGEPWQTPRVARDPSLAATFASRLPLCPKEKLDRENFPFAT